LDDGSLEVVESEFVGRLKEEKPSGAKVGGFMVIDG
jgi:hypothetical protein